MISDRQLEANRRNAQHSTGPQTPEGRAAVRNNAVTHGLTAQNAVLPDESKEEFDALFATFEAEYQPAGPTETLLLTQIVMDAWRLRCLRSMETAFSHERQSSQYPQVSCRTAARPDRIATSA